MPSTWRRARSTRRSTGLEGAGLLKSSWAPGATRRRRVYALTAKGRRTLGARRTEWSTFAQAIDSVLTEAPA